MAKKEIKSRDYIINMTKEHGEILYPSKEIIQFNDVSKIDKITSHLSEAKFKKLLKENNSKMLRGEKYILETNANNTKGNIYRLLLDETTSVTEKYLYDFDDYIDERIERVDSFANLELAHTSALKNYIDTMLDELIRAYIDSDFNAKDVFSKNGLIPKDVVTHVDKVKDDYLLYSPSKKDSELDHIGRSLYSYKALRSLLMEYIAFKNESGNGLSKKIYSKTNSYQGKYYLKNEVMDEVKEDIKRKVK